MLKKFKKGMILCLVFMMVLSVGSGCGKGDGATGSTDGDFRDIDLGETSWDAGSSISEEMVVLSGEADEVLGDLNSHGIEIFIPEGSFDVPTEVALLPVSDEVTVDLNEFSPASDLYRMEIRGDQPRSNRPLEVTIAVSEETLQAANETEGFRAVHYDETFEGWTYARPVDIDLGLSTLTFETFHNYFWGSGELTDKERLSQELDDMSRRQWVASQMDEDVEELTSAIVDEMLMDAFNEHNQDIAAHIAREVANDVLGGIRIDILHEDGTETEVGVMANAGLANDILQGDYDNASRSIAERAGRALSERLSDETLRRELGSGYDHTSTVAESLGAMMEGDFRTGAENLSNHIISNSRVLSAGKLAIDSIDMKINNWRDDEIEKAYQIYINGVESRIPWWGYNVEAGDFKSLYAQMSGLAHKIQSDALRRFAERRNMTVDEIPHERAEEIRNQAANDLEEQFKLRREQDAEIEKLRQRNEYVVDRMMDWDLLNRHRDFFPDDMPIEVQVNRVFGQIERVMQDTGRSKVIYDEGYFLDLEEDEIRLEQILDAIRTNYQEGHEAYMERLIELELIEEEVDRIVSYFGYNANPLTSENAEDSIGSSFLYDNVGIPLMEAFKYLGPIRVHEDNSFSASTSLSKTLNYQLESGHDVTYQMNVEYLRLSGSFTSNDWDEGLSGTATFYARFSSQAHSSITGEVLGVVGTAETLARYQNAVRGTMTFVDDHSGQWLWVIREVTDVRSSGGARARTTSSDGVVNDYEIDSARTELELARQAGGPEGTNFSFRILNP